VSPATVIVLTVTGGPRLTSMLESLGDRPSEVEVLVVDNGSQDPGVAQLGSRIAGVEVIRMEQNVGYTRAVNLAARQARGEAIVLLNDDCTCDPGYVESIVAELDPSAGVTMAAGVMREERDPTTIDTAGMQVDRTLLVFDYLNGEPVDCLGRGVPDPIGPSGAAAAFDREAFLSAGGFDENLFAYWEDVDLVLRMRLDGARCALARDATGVHHHSATLGSGSRRKNYLTGFGRGYMLRKWSVLSSPRRLARALLEDGAICLGQAVMDRNVEGVRGRLHGLRAAPPGRGFPTAALAGATIPPGPRSTLRRRLLRRRRLRSQP
jgi:N-acetylglucosaminyl-diphospho-decaprenol L-rhamnosyltransferase